jgi:hypothetical protein
LFGEVRLRREMVRGVVLAQQRHVRDREELMEQILPRRSPAPSQARHESDLVLLSNNDRVRGKVTAIERGSLAVETAAGAVKLPLSRVEAVGFGSADVRGAEPSPAPSLQRRGIWVVGLRDGSLIYAREVVASGKELRIVVDETLTLAGGDASDVVFLQRLGTPVVYLSDLEAVDYRHVPYLSLEWPLARDRSVTGGPLKVGGKRYLKGLGMHSASRVTYRLDGKYSRFNAAVAIDDSAQGRGSVTFGVYVVRNGKLSEAHNSDIVRGGDAPRQVSVDVAAAQALVLTVDFAERGDEMDRADWLDARVVLTE